MRYTVKYTCGDAIGHNFQGIEADSQEDAERKAAIMIGEWNAAPRYAYPRRHYEVIEVVKDAVAPAS
jgi:hypothetical protein